MIAFPILSFAAKLPQWALFAPHLGGAIRADCRLHSLTEALLYEGRILEGRIDAMLRFASPRRHPGWLINRNFSLLWMGQALSDFGDILFETTLVVWIATGLAGNRSWAPLAASGVALADALPFLLVGPLAGVLVDRWEKRYLMLWMDAIRAGLIALLWLAAAGLFFQWSPGSRLSLFGQLGLIYTIVFFSSVCTQFFGPARLALLGQIVAEPDRVRASGLTNAMSQTGVILALPLAPFLLESVGAQWALLINALSFVTSFLFVRAIQPPPVSLQQRTGGQHFWEEFATGWGFYSRNRVLMTLLILVVIAVFNGGTINALLIFFLLQNLHGSPILYGPLGLAVGLGGLVGAAGAAWLARRLGLIRSQFIALLLMGAAFLAFSRMTRFLPAVILLACFSIPQVVFFVTIGPLLLRVTPEELIGRVYAVLGPARNLALLIGTALAGELASSVFQQVHIQIGGVTFGPIDTIFLGVGILYWAAALYALLALGLAEPPPVVREEEQPATEPSSSTPRTLGHDQ